MHKIQVTRRDRCYIGNNASSNKSDEETLMLEDILSRGIKARLKCDSQQHQS